MMHTFWWGHMSKESKIHWMSWDKMGKSKSVGVLGFKDLIMFNKALLAKQGWRFIQNPSSLTTQIFKAKYFPNSSFVESSLGNRPSFVWRSIFASIELLQQGLVWRVGDGKGIHVWQDRWLSIPISYAVQSPQRIIGEDTWVAALINSDLCSWKTTLLQEVFNEEAKVIANIPLSPTLPPDRLIWNGIIDGVVTVRSAYHMGMEIQERSKGSPSSDGNGQENPMSP